MGVDTTCKCDAPGCSTVSDSLAGWYGMCREEHEQCFNSVVVGIYGARAHTGLVERGESLACSESCLFKLIQPVLAAHRPAKGGGS